MFQGIYTACFLDFYLIVLCFHLQYIICYGDFSSPPPFSHRSPSQCLWVGMALPCWEMDFKVKCISTFQLVIRSATLVMAVLGSNTTAHTCLGLNWLTQQLPWYREREDKTNRWAGLTHIINLTTQAQPTYNWRDWSFNWRDWSNCLYII